MLLSTLLNSVSDDMGIPLLGLHLLQSWGTLALHCGDNLESTAKALLPSPSDAPQHVESYCSGIDSQTSTSTQSLADA